MYKKEKALEILEDLRQVCKKHDLEIYFGADIDIRFSVDNEFIFEVYDESSFFSHTLAKLISKAKTDTEKDYIGYGK